MAVMDTYLAVPSVAERAEGVGRNGNRGVYLLGFAGGELCDLAAMRCSDALGRFVGACLVVYVRT